MPEDVKDVFGQALLDLQFGDTPAIAKRFGERVARDVWKLVEDHDGETYRVAYAATIGECVYVLHAFQKKSKRGGETLRADRELVEARLKAAYDHARRTDSRGPQ